MAAKLVYRTRVSDCLPCPFCGNKRITIAKFRDDDTRIEHVRMMCEAPNTECGMAVSTLPCTNVLVARKIWDTRVNNDEPAPEALEDIPIRECGTA